MKTEVEVITVTKAGAAIHPDGLSLHNGLPILHQKSFEMGIDSEVVRAAWIVRINWPMIDIYMIAKTVRSLIRQSESSAGGGGSYNFIECIFRGTRAGGIEI